MLKKPLMRACLNHITALTVLSFAVVVEAGPLPIEYFIKDSDYLDVALSPSGNRIAARAQLDGKIVLIVMDRETKAVVGGLQPEASDAIHSFSWVSDDRIVFSYAEQLSGSDQRSSAGELYAVNFDGSDIDRLAGFRASNQRYGSRIKGSRDSERAAVYLLDALHDDENHVLVIKFPFSQTGLGRYTLDGSKAPIVSKLHVYSGKQETVERLNFKRARPLTDSSGEVRFVTYETEDGLTQSAYRHDKNSEWQLLSEAFDLDDELTVVGLNDTGDALFLRGPAGDDGYKNIFRFDFNKKTLRVLFTGLDADVSEWLSDPETGEIVIASSHRGKARHHYAEAETRYQRLHRLLVKAYANQTLTVMSRSRDGKQIILRASSDVDPGSIFIFDAETGKADFFWANRSWMDPSILRPMHISEVLTQDGFSIPVRLTLPDGDGPAPLIVNPHGGPHGVFDEWAFNYETQLLASRGYAVLQINFRGSGGLGKKFEDAGHKEWGGQMIEDIAAATRWAMTHRGIDERRVCAYGGSYGAYASYMLAAREPSMLRCVIGYVGVYDLSLLYRTGDIPKSWGGVGYLERAVGRDDDMLADFSPVNHASKITAASMLIHGEDDNRAPIDHAYAMRDALRATGTDPDWLEIDDSGHGAGNIRTRLELYEALLGFLDQHLR
ncbi:MAG: hypothetical protein CBC82_04385 [Cellvibrionales bacterium TMED122]|nr:MAG: hypothetical protein CBC82_04385 [Cellvibrionales bacterium TMED122]